MDQNNQLIPTNEHLLDEINDLKAQLAETRETLLAIQSGSIDALVINNVAGSQIYTLQGADYPYRVLIENMFEGAATISGDLEVVYCNRRLAEMLYLDNRFIVGKNIHNFIYPDDLSAFNQIFEKGKTATHNGEIRIKSPSGQLTDVLVSCTPLNLENAMVCMVFVELSEIKKVQAELRTINENLDALVQQRTAELRESQQRWSITLKSIGDAVISNDPTGKITFVNKKAEELMGWNQTEIMNEPVSKFLNMVDETARPVKFEKIGDLQTEDINSYRFLINRKGKKIPVEYVVSLMITPEGEKLGSVLVFRDISQRKEAENVIKNYNLQLEETVKIRTAELEHAKERAESADKLKTAFLLNMSHELRTPLNSIIGFSGILLKQLSGPLNSEQEKQLDMVQTSGRHLLSLISDILDISKIEAGELKPEYETFDLFEVIDDVIKSVEPQADNKGLKVVFQKTEPLLMIESDKIRLRQVLINLVFNAVKFTEKGQIRLRCDKENNTVQIEVTDTGIGIKEEDIGKLFNPFIQLENNLVRRFAGSGLGLSISKKIIDMLQGTIQVRSIYGEGSSFIVRIPMNDLNIESAST